MENEMSPILSNALYLSHASWGCSHGHRFVQRQSNWTSLIFNERWHKHELGRQSWTELSRLIDQGILIMTNQYNATKKQLQILKVVFVCLPVFVCSTAEIPQFRLPYEVVQFEIDLMKDLGIKVPVKERWGGCQILPNHQQPNVTDINNRAGKKAS